MTAPTTGLALYDATADATASGIIRRYSTSFGLASKLLGRDVRQHVENVYALVRVADEIVDGPGAQAGLGRDALRALLDAYEAEAERAMDIGFSADLVVHAFARTARECGFGSELTRPFFASMRADLDVVEHDAESFDRYVHGSAEVVGLMCLRAFVRGRSYPASTLAELERGAEALGAAFQKVNFLRDLAADVEALGRSYFPGVDVATFDEATKARLVADVDADLATAAEMLPVLPSSSRRAVALALGLFAELNRRIEATPAAELLRARVRVPDAVKVRIAVAAAAGRVTIVPEGRS